MYKGEILKARNKKWIIFITVIVALFVPIGILAFNGISIDYWLWLGCPNPIEMLIIDTYPGHDLTAKYRHEDYFKEIPSISATYNTVLLKYGEPLEIEKQEVGNNLRIRATYDDFYLNYLGNQNMSIEDYAITSIVITSSQIRFTKDRIKVGDSKERIAYCYRYYDAINKNELSEGYVNGYIDGSMLTGQTWVQFNYDENSNVKTIEISCPY